MSWTAQLTSHEGNKTHPTIDVLLDVRVTVSPSAIAAPAAVSAMVGTQ